MAEGGIELRKILVNEWTGNNRIAMGGRECTTRGWKCKLCCCRCIQAFISKCVFLFPTIPMLVFVPRQPAAAAAVVEHLTDWALLSKSSFLALSPTKRPPAPPTNDRNMKQLHPTHDEHPLETDLWHNRANRWTYLLLPHSAPEWMTLLIEVICSSDPFFPGHPIPSRYCVRYPPRSRGAICSSVKDRGRGCEIPIVILSKCGCLHLPPPHLMSTSIMIWISNIYGGFSVNYHIKGNHIIELGSLSVNL